MLRAHLRVALFGEAYPSGTALSALRDSVIAP
jgi:hypothetical protein